MKAPDRTLGWTVALMLLVAANYLLWLLGLGDVARTALLVMDAVCILAILWEQLRQHALLLPLLLLFILLLCLDSPLVSWDARCIWFLHAKRMFYDGSLYARLDNYGGFAHNDYPDIVPSLAATITRAFGIWNEVLPKLAVFIVLVPPFTLLFVLFRHALLRWILLGATLVSLRSYLLDGLMDGALALYAATLVIYSCRLLSAGPSQEHKQSLAGWLLAPAILAILCGLKNEGIVFALFYMLSYAIFLLWAGWPRRHAAARMVALAPSFICTAIWKVGLSQSTIANDLLQGKAPLLMRLQARLDISCVSLILKYTLERGLFLIALGCYATTLFKPEEKMAKGFILLLMTGYYFVLFFIYLITPNDLMWHLQTSSDRVIMPITLSFFIFYIWFWERHGGLTVSHAAAIPELDP